VPRGAGRHCPDAVAFSIHIDGVVHHTVDVVHHTVLSGATEIGHHVLRYLLPATPSEIDRHGPR
jgi:hypothetical protein